MEVHKIYRLLFYNGLFALFDKLHNINFTVAGFPVNDEIVDSILSERMICKSLEKIGIDSYSMTAYHCDLVYLFNSFEACGKNF